MSYALFNIPRKKTRSASYLASGLVLDIMMLQTRNRKLLQNDVCQLQPKSARSGIVSCPTQQQGAQVPHLDFLHSMSQHKE